MTIELLKDLPEKGAKWTKGKVIQDVYGPDGQRLIEAGDAKEYQPELTLKAEKKAVEKPKPEQKTSEG